MRLEFFCCNRLGGGNCGGHWLKEATRGGAGACQPLDMVSILATYFTRLSLFRGFKNSLSVVIPLVVITLVCGLTKSNM